MLIAAIGNSAIITLYLRRARSVGDQSQDLFGERDTMGGAQREKRFALSRSSVSRGRLCFTPPVDQSVKHEEDYEPSERSFFDKTDGDQKLFLMKSLF